MPAPTAEDVQAYLGFNDSGWESADIESAFDAEKAAQAQVCVVPADDADWPADLVEAVLEQLLA